MPCSAKIRPFWPPSPLEVNCDHPDEGHPDHHSAMVNRTRLNWAEEDRRNFRGPWEACPGCILPAGHQGSHSV